MTHEILDSARSTTRERAPLDLKEAAALLQAPRDQILDELLVRSCAVTNSLFHREPSLVSSRCNETRSGARRATTARACSTLKCVG